MKIAHIVTSLAGTSIPVEIATAINDLPGIESYLVSADSFGKLPDTTSEDVVVSGLCGQPSLRTLMGELERRGYDIVHTHHNRLSAKIGLLSRLFDVIHVNTQHGHIHYSLPQKGVNAVILATSEGLIYNSEATRQSYNYAERLVKRGTSEYVCPNGVDVGRIAPYHTTIDEVTVGVTACRLIERTNLQSLIGAMRYADLNLRIIGDGPRRASLEALTERYGLTDSVTFLGYLAEREDVYSEMAEADVFVLPSHSEGFGVSIAEAMAIGLPPIVSDIPVFHEVVGETGLFVDRHDPKAIANSIQRLQNDPELARRLGSDARHRIEENFTLSQTARAYVDAYERIVKEPDTKYRR